VLVPLDGSELSAGALGPATALGGATDTTYVLLHVIEPPYAPGAALQPAGFEFPEEQVQAMRREAETQLDAAAESLRAKGCTVETVTELAVPVANRILRQAESRQADLVAIATRGRGGISRAVLGSVADKVIRGAECPVLITRPPNR